MKVLVAEDTKSNLCFIEACILEAGFEVITASDGIEALEKFEEHQPDLVLFDVIMPRMDGIEAARQIRSQTSNHKKRIPIIFISAMNNDADVVKGLEVGGDDYICKPVSQVVLNAKLRATQRVYAMQHELDEANKKLKLIVDYDALTGLANRRKFNDQLLREWKRAHRAEQPLSLCICDVDYFKQYNDHYGHQAGDDALVAVAQCLEKSIKRPGDLVTRYGGEEFAIILPDTDMSGAMTIIERARQQLESLALEHKKSAITDVVTMSAGVTSVFACDEDVSLGIRQLLKTADNALYESKAQGRNRVTKEDFPLEVSLS